MKLVACILVLFGLPVFGFGQESATTKVERNHFRWTKRNAHELDRQTVRTSKELTSAQKNLLIQIIAAQIRPFKPDLEIASERELRNVAANTRLKLIDLNEDGIPEVLAQAFGLKAGCGATGNCPLWVFQNTPAGFRKILDTRGRDGIGGIEVITVNPNRTNGFSDLVLGTHDSASERTLLVYRFLKGKYQQAECYNANWVSIEGGSWRTLRDPEITVCH